MKKSYTKPTIEKITLDLSDVICTSGCFGHYDANGKWHDGGHGNQHYVGVNYEGPNNGHGLG